MRMRTVVMEAPPGSPFESTQADLLLEILVVLLDPPPELGQGKQRGNRDSFRQG
jgi:hypothetical protein